jgi:PAS domain S-box-containing protein
MSNEQDLQALQQQVEALKQALAEEKQKSRQLSEQLQNAGQGWSATWEMDLLNKTLHWSDEMFDLLQVDTSLKPDMKFLREKLSPEGVHRLNGVISRIFVSGEEYSFEHTLANGKEERNVRSDLKPVLNTSGEPVKLVGKLTDISLVKSAQKELEKLSIIAAQTSNAVATLHTNSEIDWVNRAFTIMTGYRPDEAKGKLFDSLFSEEFEKPSREIFSEAFTTVYSVIRETQLKTKSGNKLWVVINASPVLDYQLNAESYIVIITDITDRKIAEEQLALKNKEITDSIRYAKRIQDALLPSEDLLKEHFSDSFVLYRPKDIVSGDFYWMREVEGLVYLAVADCTGHGVPGAFVSLIGNRGLTRAVTEFGLKDPGEILDKLTELVEEGFNLHSGVQVKDGMDIALLVFDFKNKKIAYAGANNPLYHISGGNLIETKATKQPIGSFDNRRSFISHTVPFNKGDLFYLFSDGYADQFGGEKGKKLKYKTFKELLLSGADKSMGTQAEQLEEYFKNWKGELQQVDDVCIMGVRL